MPKYKVEICRVSYSFTTVEIEAETRLDAFVQAEDNGGNYSDYKEKSADYSVEGITEIE